MQWHRISSDILNTRLIQQLSPEDFKNQFLRRLRGDDNIFSNFISKPHTRPTKKEWAVLRDTVFKRDSYTCTYCGIRGAKMECDHILPVSKGGGHALNNLTSSCFTCNRSKGSRLLSDWRVKHEMV